MSSARCAVSRCADGSVAPVPPGQCCPDPDYCWDTIYRDIADSAEHLHSYVFDLIHTLSANLKFNCPHFLTPP